MAAFVLLRLAGLAVEPRYAELARAALEPVIAALGGLEALAETAQAIIDVGRWWP